MQYSRGFNPRPKLSLPLPRTVGVASDDDLLCLQVHRDLMELRGAEYLSRIKAGLSGRLPKDCELLSIEAEAPNVSFQPTLATYIFLLRAEYISDKVKAGIERLLASDSLILRRRMDAKNSKFKNVNVRPFLKSIELDDRAIVVECKISPDGTIRVDEILQLLALDADMLTAPIRRTSVRWQVSGS